MNELVECIEREKERPSVLQEPTLDRCGLCCVLIPTTTFSKGGVVCQHLLLDGEATRCAVYSSRPEECQNFHCNCQDMIARLDDFIMQIMRGKQSIVYYREDNEYQEGEDILKAIEAMNALKIFRHSQIINKFPRRTLEALGINQFI